MGLDFWQHFYSKALIENPLLVIFTLFSSNLICHCQIWEQDQNEEFKDIEKTLRKGNRDYKFPALKCSS